LVLKNCSFQYCLLNDVNIDALFTLSKQHGYQWRTRLRECVNADGGHFEHFVTVIALQTVHWI